MIEQGDIAILLFSRSARLESEVKSWLASQEKSTNESLAKALISNTKKTLAESGFPIFHFNEQKQVGNSFGEKIANAFEEVFSQGFQSVICVGNDCINLGEVNWSEITLDLSSGKNVIGPDFRNGAYLIGLNKDDFHKSTFAHLSWQTEDLFDDLKSYLNKPTILPQLRDFNDSRDLFLLKKESTWLRRLLRQLITFHFPNHSDHSGWGDDQNTPYGRRGPPSLF